ncbi:ubiquitin family protein [Nitzschia inconspicua]|uniref:Ubiquitin family protein n=1 Tax=Nitzschia inconspicua TaxID=303405 RepID=A0A9K3KBT9_9STRA|nr:ubiquitin family protein [Nitzschia inconspicua]
MVERTRSVRKSGSSRALGSSSHHSTSTPAKENNPIKTDAELNILVNSKLQSIEKYKTFQRWKGKFLERFETFLYQKGMDPAQKEADALQETLLKLTKQTAKVLDYIDKNELSQDKKTVKASLALNEMCNTLEEARKELQGLIPSLKAEERKLGYSKFHLGSVLIQQNFPQYVLMETVRNDLASIGKTMEEVLDRQQHDAFGHYNKQVVRFCDIMADLDMYEIMKKCIRFRNPPDESESEDPVEMEVHIVNTDENDEQITIEMLETDTIAMLQEMIAIGFESLKPDRQVLTYKGSTVSDTPTKTLLDLGVQNGDKMFVKLYKMPLTIKLFDDSMPPKRYEVDPTDFVSTLQRKCAPDFIPASNQQLFLNDQPMEVTNRIQDYANPNDVIILEPKMIDVKAEMADGKIAELKLCFGTDTLEDIKKRIETATFMPIEKQVIYYHQAPLASLKDDGKTKLVVREMGLRNGDTLQVQTFTIPIIVECWDGKIIETKIDPDITLGQLKLVLKDVTDIEPGNQILSTKKDNKTLKENATSVKDHGVIANDVLQLEPMSFSVDLAMPDGSKAQVMVSPNDDADTIKRKIEDTTGMKAPRQVLKDMAGKELPSGKTAKEMGLREGTPLKVEIFKIPVKVQTWDDKTVDLMVEPCETLSDIKKMLEPDSGIVADNQVISKAGDVLQDDAKTANDLGIVANDVLQLEPLSFNVDLTMPDGSKAQVMLSPNDDEDAIKRKIEDTTGMKAPRQVLKDMAGEELPSGKTAKEMGLREGTPLKVEIFKIPVKVQTWDDKTVDLMVEPCETLSDIKKMLEPDTGIAADNQVISKAGDVLQDDAKTANDLGIVANDVLQLEPLSFNVDLTMPDGSKAQVMLSPNDDEDAIKRKIEDTTGMKAPRQVLKDMAGEELPSGKTAKEMGLREGTPLKVEIFKIPVKVQTWDDKTVDLMVEPCETLSDIKKMLEPDTGIAADNQVISKAGDVLQDDAKTANDLGIVANDVLQLEPMSFNVDLTMPDGSKAQVMVSPNDDADTIKRKIEDTTGMKAPRQVLKDMAGEELPSGKTAKEMGLREGTPLKVEIFKIPVKVQTWDDKTVDMMVEPCETLSDIKKMLEPDSGIAADNQVISKAGDVLQDDAKTANDLGIVANDVLQLEPLSFNVDLTMPDGSKAQVMLSPNDDEDAIKRKIEDTTGMKAPRQVLKDMAGEELPSGKTAKEMGLREGTPLKVEIFKIPVKVQTWDDKTVDLMVEPCETLSDIKKMLEPDTGIAADNQVISKAGDVLQDDAKTANDLGIVANDVLQLEPMSFNVDLTMPDGSKAQVMVSPNDDADTIKRKIEDTTGMKAPRQVLKDMAGEELPSGKTAKEMGLREGTPLKVEIFKIPVKVQTWDDKTVDMMVEPCETLSDIKKMLEPDSGIAADNQVISKAGDVLQDDAKTANDLGIVANDVLQLEPLSFNVDLTMPDGSKAQVMLSPNDDEDAIKRKIEDTTGMKAPRQVLKDMAGEELPSGKTAKEMGLREGTPLKVEIFKIPVKVQTWDDKTVDLMVEPCETLSDIKKMLEPDSGVAADNQVISKAGDVLQDDAKTANDLGIVANDVLQLEPMSFNVDLTMPDGSKAQVMLSPNDDADAIKRKIEDTTGMKAPRQVLKDMAGEELPSGKTAKEMGLREGTPLKVEIFKIPVKVQTWDDKTVDLMVEPCETLSDIKKMLEPDSGIAADNQVISKAGDVLQDDAKTANDLGIVANDVLQLDPMSFNIDLTMPDGSKAQVMVSPNDDADTIKRKIEDTTGMKAPRQVLKDMAGEELPSGKTAKEMGLREGTPLKVEIFKIPVKVQTWDDKTVDLMVEPCETLSDIKKMLEPDSGIAADNQVISKAGDVLQDDAKTANDLGIVANDVLQLEPLSFNVDLTMPDGSKAQVMLSPNDDVDAIKRKIEGNAGIDANRLRLCKDGMELLNAVSAKKLGLREGDCLDVDFQKIQVKVICWNRPPIDLLVEPLSSVSSLKDMLAVPAAITPKNQNLRLDGIFLSEDTATLTSCGIKKGTELHLEPFSIACHAEMPDGAKHDLLLPLSADLNKVKDLIEDVSGLGSNRQVVKNKGRKLPENSEMQVRDMGIQDDDILNVSINAFPITVNCYGGKTIHILIEPSQKLIDVKMQLEAESGIAAKNQRLSLGDNEIAEDSKTTAMLGISPERAVLDLEPLSVRVNCIMPDQTTHGVDLYLSDDTDAIKHKIAVATGMVAPRQIVRHRGVILPESGKTVKTLGIYEGTTLAVEVLKVPLYVNIPDGRQLKLMFDLTEPLAALKEELVTESGVPISKQLLSMCGGDEFIGDTTAVSKFGVVEGSILDLEIRDDPIVFVDCKYGTMFALQRQEAIESGVFTLNQGNPYEFVETENRPAAKEKMAKSMLESTNLGVKPQVVVDKTDVEDYDVAEAEAVKNKWGVALKKTSKNQKGNEFLFVDVKTDSVGYLDRQKLMETKFITVVGFGKNETLEQAEKDQQRYDYFVREIRRIFRISSAK